MVRRSQRPVTRSQSAVGRLSAVGREQQSGRTFCGRSLQSVNRLQAVGCLVRVVGRLRTDDRSKVRKYLAKRSDAYRRSDATIQKRSRRQTYRAGRTNPQHLDCSRMGRIRAAGTGSLVGPTSGRNQEPTRGTPQVETVKYNIVIVGHQGNVDKVGLQQAIVM